MIVTPPLIPLIRQRRVRQNLGEVVMECAVGRTGLSSSNRSSALKIPLDTCVQADSINECLCISMHNYSL